MRSGSPLQITGAPAGASLPIVASAALALWLTLAGCERTSPASDQIVEQTIASLRNDVALLRVQAKEAKANTPDSKSALLEEALALVEYKIAASERGVQLLQTKPITAFATPVPLYATIQPNQRGEPYILVRWLETGFRTHGFVIASDSGNWTAVCPDATRFSDDAKQGYESVAIRRVERLIASGGPSTTGQSSAEVSLPKGAFATGSGPGARGMTLRLMYDGDHLADAVDVYVCFQAIERAQKTGHDSNSLTR